MKVDVMKVDASFEMELIPSLRGAIWQGFSP